MALGKWANFYRLNKSFIVSVSGNSETKSFAVSLSVTASVSTSFPISKSILMVSLRRVCFSAGLHQVHKRQILISYRTSLTNVGSVMWIWPVPLDG
jgi:hypothetical protein